MRLNPGQQQAVEFVTGPCLVLDGAGSGKTRVITNKIAHLIRGCGYQARHIAAVTFTNKAARDMKASVRKTLGRQEPLGLRLSTFHSLGMDMANGVFLRQLAEIGTILDLLEMIQIQFLFFYKDMQCCCCFCHDRALSGKVVAGYTTTLLFSPPDFH